MIGPGEIGQSFVLPATPGVDVNAENPGMAYFF
jgi:hypothetical protein